MGKHLSPEPDPAHPSIFRRIAFVVGLIFIGTAAVIAGFSIAQKRNPLSVMLEPFVQSPQQAFGKNNLLVLVVGLDYDYDPKDQETSANSRSDIIKAINLDFVNKQAFQLNVPRDMVATMPDGRQAKINEAQSEGGIKEAQGVISKWLGIGGFDRYVILRIDAMQQVIDAMGGVDVTVKTSDCLVNNACRGQTPLQYTDTWGHLNINLKPGFQHLNGANAVGYARFRHDWCGDPCRLLRQDQVVRSMVQKIKGDRVNTLLHADQLLGVIRKNVTTNLTTGELAALANYFMDISPSAIHQDQVPYVNDITLADGGDALVPDEVARDRLVKTMLTAPPTPMPSPNPIQLAAIPPGTVKVDIENGSGVEGAGHRVATTLKEQGFVIGDISDAPASVNITEIHEHTAVSFAGAKVRDSLPGGASATIIRDAGPNAQVASDITIVVGKDLATAPPGLKSKPPV